MRILKILLVQPTLNTNKQNLSDRYESNDTNQKLETVSFRPSDGRQTSDCWRGARRHIDIRNITSTTLQVSWCTFSDCNQKFACLDFRTFLYWECLCDRREPILFAHQSDRHHRRSSSSSTSWTLFFISRHEFVRWYFESNFKCSWRSR